MALGKTYSTKYLVDSNGNTGAANQVLVSTATGIDWVDGSGSVIIGGPYLPLTAGASYPLTDALSFSITSNTSFPAASIKHNSNGYVYFSGGTNGALFGNSNQQVRLQANATNIEFLTGGTTKVIIASSGNVGIGTTAPVNKIQTNYAPVAIASLTANAGTASTNWNRNAFLMGTGASVSNALAFGVSGTANDRKAWIQSGHPDSAADSLGSISLNPLGGNVGIGTTPTTSTLLTNLQVKNALLSGYSNSLYISQNSVYNSGWKYIASSYASKIQADQGITFSVANTGTAGAAITYNDAMFISHLGNVGIGTTAPGAKLHIAATTTWGEMSNPIINIQNNGTGGNINIPHNMGSITWKSGSVSTAEIKAVRNTPASGDNVELRFSTSQAGVQGERMTIDNVGNVGIGTTAPAKKLSVLTIDTFTYDPAVNAAEISVTRANTSNTAGQVAGISLNATGWSGGTTGVVVLNAIQQQGNYSNADFAIQNRVGGSFVETFRITAYGDVGIGTDSPGSKLEVRNTDNTVVDATIATWNSNTTSTLWNLSTTNTTGNFIQYANAAGSGSRWYTGSLGGSSFSSSFVIGNRTATSTVTERLRITSTGNVGIGTTAPNAQLDAFTTQGGSTIAATHGTGGTYPKASGISFGATSTSLSVSNNAGTVVFTGGAGMYANNTAASNNPTELVFWTTSAGSPADRLTIASTGAATFSSSVTAVGLSSTTSAAGNLNSQIRNTVTAASAFTGYGLAIESEASAATSYALTVRNLDASQTYFHVATETGKVGNVGIGTTSPTDTLTVNGTFRTPSLWTTSSGITQWGGGGSPYGTLTWDTGYARINATSGNRLDLGASGGLHMTISTAGNVGIGTTAPATKLHIDYTTGTGLTLSNTVANLYVEMRLQSASSSAYIFKGSNGYSSYGGANALNIFNEGQIAFHSSTVSNIMRITSAGNVGIGTTNPNGKLTVDNGPSNIPTLTLNSLTGGQYYGNINCYDPYHGIILRGIPAAATDYTVTAQDSMSFYEYGSDFRFYKKTAVPSLQLDAQILAGAGRFRGDVIAFYSFSDERLKDDVKPLENSLDKVLALQGVSYKWNLGERKGQSDIGLIAQQVEKVIPEVVRDKTNIDGDTYKSVNYEHLVGVLIEAIKDQQKQIDELKAKLK